VVISQAHVYTYVEKIVLC